MTSLLPVSIQDEKTLNLEKTAEKAFTRDLKELMIYAFDHVKPDLLNLLAEQFHILGDEGWNLAKTEQEKRDLLKISLEIHRYKGTKHALLRVLEILKLKGGIKEWFEYDGNPYFFRVVLQVFDRPLDDETEALFFKLINTFKNARSRLEAIEMYLSSTTELRTYCRMLFGEVMTIKAKR